jgi:hypothetical protein
MVVSLGSCRPPRAEGGGSWSALLAAALIVLGPSFSATDAGAVVPPGLSDPGQAVHALRCQKLLNKGMGKYLSTWSKTYAKCVGSIAACVQTKGSDPACLAKATATCNKSIPKLGDDNEGDLGSSLQNLVTNFCGSLTLSNQLSDPGGPHFALLSDDCKNRFGISSLSTGVGVIARCMFRETNCAAETLLLGQMPRARALLDLAGIVVGNAVDPNSCLVDEGGSGDLGDSKADKAVVACQKAVGKAGAKFVSKARGSFAKCADAVSTCAQTTPTQKCIDKAAKTCGKQVPAVGVAQTKLHDTVTKACGKIPFGDLTDANGGDVTALAKRCSTFGVASLATLDDYAACIAEDERCQVEDSMRFTVPRIAELFTAVGQTFGGTCPAP